VHLALVLLTDQSPFVMVLSSRFAVATNTSASLAGNSEEPASPALLAFLGGQAFWHSGQARVSGISGLQFGLAFLAFRHFSWPAYRPTAEWLAFEAVWLPLAPDNWHFWNASLSGDDADMANPHRPTPRGVKRPRVRSETTQGTE